LRRLTVAVREPDHAVPRAEREKGVRASGRSVEEGRLTSSEERNKMTLKTEKEIRQVVQVGIATAMILLGYPLLGSALVVLLLPWQPVYWVASYLGETVLEVRAKKTVKRAMKKFVEESAEAA
jgi:hypothetical protein